MWIKNFDLTQTNVIQVGDAIIRVTKVGERRVRLSIDAPPETSIKITEQPNINPVEQ